MTDIRTKLAAFAPAFVEVLESLSARIDTLVAGCNSHTRRIEALELWKGSEGDMAWANKVDDRIDTLEKTLQVERELLTKTHNGLDRALARIEALEAAAPMNQDYNSQAQLRELVLAARDGLAYLETTEAGGAAYARMTAALQHFEAVK